MSKRKKRNPGKGILPFDNYLQSIFVTEVRNQCRFALQAENQLHSALSSNNTVETFAAIQALLTAVANVSKLLWPTRSRLADRGNTLRNLLAVSDESPVKSKDFRNHFEHFDDRLEDWALESKRRNIADMNVGSMDKIKGIDSSDFLRNFDSNRFILTFRGQTYDIGKVCSEVRKIEEKAGQHSIPSAQWPPGENAGERFLGARIITGRPE